MFMVNVFDIINWQTLQCNTCLDPANSRSPGGDGNGGGDSDSWEKPRSTHNITAVLSVDNDFQIVICGHETVTSIFDNHSP